MSWTRAGDLRAQVLKRWDRGELLRLMVTEEDGFPLRLSLNGPTSKEIAEQFDAVRSWISHLREVQNVRLEMREFTHRVIGLNEVPQSAWVDSFDEAIALIGKRREAAQFRSMVELTRQRQPQLIAWLAKRPMRALQLSQEWDRLLEVVDWVRKHPRPGIYIRQMDIPGVHSKFVENHRGVLSELLELVLPPEAISANCSGIAQFAPRYGFKEKPLRIRFRVLDENQAPFAATSQPDITLDIESFAKLDIPFRKVFITENETNFLAFPSIEEGAVIFGAGYGWDALAQAQWLTRCRLLYWGDIDTHGFAILDQLRTKHSQVESLLMTREILMAHQSLWGAEEDQVIHDLPRLNASESSLFDELRDNRIQKNLRLEQEMIGFGWLEKALKELNL